MLFASYAHNLDFTCVHWSSVRQESESEIEVERYQIISIEQGRVVMLDTATGDCWMRSSASKWISWGNPIKDRVKKSAAVEKAKGPILKLNGSVELTILQREERSIPGSDGSIRLRLGDITEGQTLLSIYIGEKSWLDRKSVSQGDTVAFKVGDQSYEVKVQELRNILVGDDFAKLIIRESTAIPAPPPPAPSFPQSGK